MSDRLKWITYKGQKIFCADYSGLEEAEYCGTMDEMCVILKTLPADTILLIQANVANTHASGKVKEKGAELTRAMERFKGSAYSVTGVTGIMKIVAKTFVKSINFANNEEEAKDWLVEQAGKLGAKQPVG